MASWKGRLYDAGREAMRLATDLAAIQWQTVSGNSVIGRSSDENPQARSLVDIEALLLVSDVLKERHRGFARLCDWWHGVGAEITSKLRLAKHRVNFPAHEICSFTDPDLPADLRLNGLALKNPALLQLRLRAGFGVSTRTDILTCIMGSGGRTASLRDLTTATGCAKSSVNRALISMETASVVTRTGPRPAKFSVKLDSWKELLGAEAFHHTADMKFARYLPSRIKYASAPRWRPWLHLYGFLTEVSFECSNALRNAGARKRLADKLHDDFERLRHGSWTTGSRLVLPSNALGPGIIDAMPEIIGDLREWYLEHI